MFHVGEKVEVAQSIPHARLGVGDFATITSISPCGKYYRVNGHSSGDPARFFKKITDDLFEDEWHLNDGKVTIPDDADKLEKDGSVVAFRKRKVKGLEFGDILIGGVTGSKYRFIKYQDSKKVSALLINHRDDVFTAQLKNYAKA